MIDAQVDTSEADAYLDATKDRIFAALREGVAEGTEILDWTVADKLQGNPIVSRSGTLLAAVLNGIQLRETVDTVSGFIVPDASKVNASAAANLALWLEEGTSVPAVSGKLMAFFGNRFTMTMQHKAFRVAPHPFLNPSLEEQRDPINDLIAPKVADAVAS